MISPSRIIGVNYLSRWHVIPRNPWFNIYLHKFTGSDDDRALHDHPWWSISFLLRGRMLEHYRLRPSEPHTQITRWVHRLWPVVRAPGFSHRLELVAGPAWTLFITGPVLRDWGFWCGTRWVPWQMFTDRTGNKIGRGCD